MKRIHIFLLCSSLSLMASAQDFIPLRIDSSYSFFRSLDFLGEPIEVTSFEGYTYNEDDDLLQIRRENERSNFSYSEDETVEVIEIFSNEFWINSKRITTSFSNDQPVQITTEIFPNGFWENSQRVTIVYNNSEEILTQRTESWGNNAWRNKELIENTYDAMGNRTLQSYANANSEGIFIFTFGDRIQFNLDNQPSEILSLTGNSMGDIFFADEFTITYNNDQLQDTIIYCLYSAPDTTNCQNISRSIFTYDQSENLVIRDIESWNNNEWVSSGRVEEYIGRNIYSALPDSILTFDYSLPTIDQLITRQYFKYTDLDDEKVRYEGSLFLYQTDLDQFVLENYREEFYRKGEIVNNNELVEVDEIILFPNPVGKNQNLSLKNLDPVSTNVEAYIYDTMGQLLQVETVGASQSFIAPNTPGIYFVQLKAQQEVLGFQKIVVQ